MKLFKCKVCNKTKRAIDIYKNICYGCAENLYTNRLGLRYIEKHPEFYLHFYGIEKVDNVKKVELLEILEKEFLDKVDLEDDWNSQLAVLKEYVLEDIDEWIGFLDEEGI